MIRSLLAAATTTLLTAAMALAQNPPDPVQAPGKRDGRDARPTRPAQTQPSPFDRGFPSTRVTAARLTALEEEVELTEAHRDVRKAHVLAAEIGVRAAEISFQHMERIAKNGVVSGQELDKAKLEVEAAKAQMQIKMAELKEIEVKVKFAKKRLEDAKAAVRPVPARPAAPVDPPPPIKFVRGAGTTLAVAGFDDKELIAALKADIEKRLRNIQIRKDEIKKAEKLVKEAEADAAKAEKEEARKLAEAKAKAFRAEVDLQQRKIKAEEDDIAKLRAKLKEVEK